MKSVQKSADGVAGSTPAKGSNPAVAASCDRAWQAFEDATFADAGRRAELLAAIADALDARRAEIIDICAAETALLTIELEPEFARMTGTLRMFSALLRDDEWRRPAHSPRAMDDSSIGPNHDLRTMLVPLGPAAVFGASNFPLAYGVCGGDTASALAAGCPVIVKEHPAHPKTGRLLHEIAASAGADAMQGVAAIQYVLNDDHADFGVATALVRHPSIRAVGFTGSTSGGLALERLARERLGSDQRPDPIPVFAEMGSLNCVCVSAASLRTRGDAIAKELAAAIASRVGQQCTKPGMIFLEARDDNDDAIASFERALGEGLMSGPPRRMLSTGVATGYFKGLDRLADAITRERADVSSTPLPGPNDRAANLGVPVVFSGHASELLRVREAWEEVFGPCVVVARLRDASDVPDRLPALGASLYLEPSKAMAASDPKARGDTLAPALQRLVRTMSRDAGRIVLNGVTPGVRVCEAMVHGGPFPVSNASHTTAVGPRAIERWCRPLSVQNGI